MRFLGEARRGNERYNVPGVWCRGQRRVTCGRLDTRQGAAAFVY